MKQALVLLAVAFLSQQSFADVEQHGHGHNNRALRAAQTLAQEVEHFDEALHNVNAPAHFIQAVHHMEETATELVDELYAGHMDHARDAYNHLRRDYQEVQHEVYSHPLLLINRQVRQEWRALQRAYSTLSHEFHFGGHHHPHH